MITIQEILGTDSIAASRLTINSNFLLLENEINDLESTFNINVVTGAIDVSQATSGQIKAKALYVNQATFPASGTPTINIYGTGASAGNASFSGTISGANLNVSGTGTFNKINASGPSTFGSTVDFSGDVTAEANLILGLTGSFVDKNAIGASGPTNAFLSPAVGGGGVTGTFSNPYPLSFTESLIYADCGYVSSASADSSNKTGFFFYIATGSATPSTLPLTPQGLRITVINSNSNDGLIGTGITGPGGGVYYTGFSTGNGQYNSAGISIGSGLAYKSSMTIQWENRVGKGSSTQNGSWVVVSSTNMTY